MKKKLLFLFSVLFALTAIAQTPTVSSGKIVHIQNFPSKYVQPRNIDIWLPNSYDPAKRYAVLYMHDGQMLYDSAITWNKQEWKVDETVSRLLSQKKIQDCIVVGIWNNDKYRLSEYYPQKPLKYLPDSIKTKMATTFFNGEPKGDNYLSFLVKELKPYIDRTYPVLKDREHTFIAGSSMGGLISLYAICQYPDVFSGAACMSTHWPGIIATQGDSLPKAFYKYVSEKLPSSKTHKIYYDYGTETLDSLYKKYQLQVDQIMLQKGYVENINFESKEFIGDDHSERSWSRRLDIPLIFLLNDKHVTN